MVAVLVKMEKNCSPGDLLLKPKIGVRLDACCIGGWYVFNGVDVAGQQRGGSSRVAGQDAQGHFLPDRLVSPVAFIPDQFNAIAAPECGQLEGAGANGGLARIEIFRAGAGCRLARNDIDRIQVVRQYGVGRLCF